VTTLFDASVTVPWVAEGAVSAVAVRTSPSMSVSLAITWTVSA
jgi:hypothetical protein